MDSEDILRIIRKSKADSDFEVVLGVSRSETIKVEHEKFSGGEYDETSYASVRCLHKGKCANIRTVVNDLHDIENAIRDAHNLAKESGYSDCQTRFSTKKLGTTKQGRTAGIIGDLTHSKDEFFKAVRAVERMENIYSINSFLSHTKFEIHGANSNGITGDQHGEISDISNEIIAKNRNEQASGGNYREAVTTDGLDMEDIMHEAAELAVGMLGAKQAKTMKGNVVLSPEATISIVSSFVSAMDAENVLKNRSFLAGKLGKVVASPLVDIREENIVKGSARNRYFDDELVKCNAKDMIKNKKLITYLHDIYTAEKMGCESTGNRLAEQHGSIGTTNVIMKPGKLSKDDLIKRAGNGVYIIDTGDSPNMTTGDLSAMITMGYKIENGSVSHPLKETMVGINMIDLMRKITALGRDTLSIGGFSCPAIMVENVQISGA